MYYFCTYFDQNYLDKGLALYQSLVEHCLPFRLWILCMDEVTYRILTEMQLPQVQLISLSDFEKDDFQLLDAKQNRSLIEYYFTCTPSLLLYVMDHVPSVNIITYLDADLFFFSSIEPVYQEMGDGSVLIIGHRFPPARKNREIFGVYNVGMLSFRRDTNGLACLHWWREQCLEWCYDRAENGRFADQKYLDDWPDRFLGVVVLQHIGVGLAPWNLVNYSYSYEKGTFLVDGQRLIMYHFHGVKRINRWIFDTDVMESKTRLPGIVKQKVYVKYVKELNHVKYYHERMSIFDNDSNIRKVVDMNESLKMEIKKIGACSLKYFKKILNNDLILLRIL